jgi:hypothetical protein
MYVISRANPFRTGISTLRLAIIGLVQKIRAKNFA